MLTLVFSQSTSRHCLAQGDDLPLSVNFSLLTGESLAEGGLSESNSETDLFTASSAAESPGAAVPAAVISSSPARKAPQTASGASSEKKNYYVPARSVGTKREPEPPTYVRNLSELDFLKDEEADWLDLGLDYRLRYEYRQDDIRRPVAIRDEPLLTRTRAYVGIRNKWDPLRGAIEFEDARRTNSHFPEDDRDVNETEIIQAIVELYFADALGEDRPLRLQAGRMAFEYVDRRLIARNQWRNTTNNFQGFRAILGQEQNDWQLDLLAVQPMERLLTQPDRPDEEIWFYGIIGDWRRWSDVITLQPYYLILDQDGKGTRTDREIHTLGVRGYGNISGTGFDYDAQGIFQVGRENNQNLQAFAFTYEVGHTWEHEWKPRLSGFAGYASGDRNPNDNTSERFDKLFGFARPWSANDYVTFENVFAPKTRIEFQPRKDLRMEVGYSAFWLASATDSWENARLQDPTGQSGSFMGQEIDLRIRFPLGERTDVTLGYAHFFPGEFPKNTGKPDQTDFLYIELSPRLLK